MSGSVGKLHWGLALLGGVLTEIGMAVVLLVAFQFGPQAPFYAIPPASLLITCAAAQWVARRAGSRFIWHGLLVGVVAAAIYIAFTVGQTLPLAYVSTHFLKIVGGLAGGWIARRRSRTTSVSAERPPVT